MRAGTRRWTHTIAHHGGPVSPGPGEDPRGGGQLYPGDYRPRAQVYDKRAAPAGGTRQEVRRPCLPSFALGGRPLMRTTIHVPFGARTYAAVFFLWAIMYPQSRNINANRPLASRIQERLLHSLNADPANWPTNVENHALSLLRSGEASSFPALLRRVIEDVRHDTELRKSDPAAGEANGGTEGSKANGEAGNKKGANGAEQRANLAVPQAVVEEALKATRECLEDVAYMES